MSEEAQGGQGSTISAVVAAKLLMVTPQRLRQLVNEGFIPKPRGRDQYSLVGVVQGYITFLKAEDRRSTKSAGASRLQDKKSEEIDMRLEERSRALINEARAEALAIVDEFAGPLRSDLMSIPARVTKDLALRTKIETEIDGAFGAAAKRVAGAAGSAGPSGGAVGAAPASASRRVGARESRVPAKRRRSRTA